MDVSNSIGRSVSGTEGSSLIAGTDMRNRPAAMIGALKRHWPEYLIEAGGLSVFMFSACAFTALLFHPSSTLFPLVAGTIWQRVLMGAAMGMTAVAIIYSPFGKRSGAHINPATTLVFYRLGKIEPQDALFYIAAQFTGGVAGVAVSKLLFGMLLAAPSVNYAATIPGAYGTPAAFGAEVAISFILMTAVLFFSNTSRLDRWTGLMVGLLLMFYITLESPISGMSMNPARTLGSAVPARVWTGLWVYFIAPPLGMLLAAEIYLRIKGGRSAVACAKLHHRNNQRCIFRCQYKPVGQEAVGQGAAVV